MYGSAYTWKNTEENIKIMINYLICVLKKYAVKNNTVKSVTRITLI